TSGLNGLAQNGVTYDAAGAIAGDSSATGVFNGSTSYIWNDQLRPAPDTYTIETWIKTDTTQGGKIVGYGSGRPNTGTQATNLSGNYDRHLYMDNSGRLNFGVWTGSAQLLRSSAQYNDNQWHHIVATQGSAGLALYVDGVKVGQNSAAAGQPYWGVWHVGGDQLNGWPNKPSSNFFKGQIDETAIYPTPLTARQVIEHYQLGGGSVAVNPVPSDAYGAAVFNANPDLYWRLDETSGAIARDSSFFGQNNGAFGNQVLLNQPALVANGKSVTLPGSSDGTVGQAQSVASPAVFSAEAWFKTDAATGGKIVGFENSQTGNGNSYDKQIYMTDAGSLKFGVYTGSAVTLTAPGDYSDGTWHHVLGSQDASGMKLYVDGVLVDSNAVTVNQSYAGYWRAGGGNLNSWPEAPSNFYFTGQVDEVAIYPNALSGSAVAEHYALGVNDQVAPSTPQNVTATVSGNDVLVAWDASTDNVAVANYVVYRGSNAGFVVGETNKIAEVPGIAFTDTTAPVGTTYYKVVAVDTSGNRSAASAGASVTVVDGQAPSVPSAVTATVSGSAATVGWTASTDNVAVTGYTVYRGATAAFVPGAGTKVADVTGTSYVDSGLAAGTYYYKVTAVDAAGNVSAGSAAAEAVIEAAPPVDTEAPSVPSAVTATVSGSAATVGWTASTDNVAVTGYTVYRGATAAFVPGAGTKVADVTGTSYVDSGLAAGTYYYKVTAVDAAGNVSAGSAAAEAVVAGPPGEPVVLTVGATADAMVYQVNPNSNYGSNNQLSSRGGSSQISSYLSFNLPDAPAGMVLTQARLQLRTSTDSTAASADTHTINLVSGAWSENTVTWNNRPTPIGDQLGALAGAPALNTNYSITLDAARLRALTGQQSLALVSGGNDNLRTWSREAANSTYRPVLTLTYEGGSVPVDTQAPSIPAGVSTSVSGSTATVTWTASTDNVGVTGYTVYRGTDSAFVANAASKRADVAGTSYADTGLAAGTYYYRVIAKDAAGNLSGASAAVAATVDSPPPPDSESPTVPTGVATAVSGANVTVTWTASTDNVGVTGYTVYRGTDSAFVANAASKRADVAGTSYADTGLAAGTYYYRVIAKDAAGNLSGASAAAAATITAPPPAPVVLTLNPTGDAMVYQANPTTNYGTNNQLSSRGGSGQISSYLAFDLPAAPAGLVLTGATLMLRTSTDSTAGSTDMHAINLVSGGWNEGAITWNNRPTALGSKLGEITGATTLNAPQTINLTTAQLKDLLGSGISMALTSTGNDNLRLWSNDAGNPTYRPLLTLTFTQQ
uniref:CBM96 family carbohydrate-binding protein n=1 Tax=Homoserinimonas sp. OAct 916 TaxID=2211450 RepID=UPI00130068BB